MVSDPVVAGVGIARRRPAQASTLHGRPGHDAARVADVFKLARRLDPSGIKKVGVAWNPSEANSEACTKVARAVCKGWGSSCFRGECRRLPGSPGGSRLTHQPRRQAIWVGGDNVVLSSLDASAGWATPGGGRRDLYQHSRLRHREALFEPRGRLPSRPGVVDRPAGRPRARRRVAGVHADPLRSPARIVAQQGRALKFVGEDWSFPADIDAKADVVVDSQPSPVRRHPRRGGTTGGKRGPAGPSRAWKVAPRCVQRMLTILEEAIGGLKRGFKEGGLTEGRDFTMMQGQQRPG